MYRKVSALHHSNLTAATSPGFPITATTKQDVPLHKVKKKTERRSKLETENHLAQGFSKESIRETHNLVITRSSGSNIHVRYHNSWIGTIRIVSRSTRERLRCAKEKTFETRIEKKQGFIQFKPAPWLSWFGLDLGLHSVGTLYGSTKLASILEPVRYVDFPSAVHNALQTRDSKSIRRMLSNGQISLHDKDYNTEQSLLDQCISSLWSYPFLREDESPTELVELSQWLISLGLTPNYEAIHHDGNSDNHPIMDAFWQLYGGQTRGVNYDESDIIELRKLFLATADTVPTILLAKTMVRFGITFPSQASYVEPFIVDLIRDSALTEDWASLEYGLRDFWDDEKTTGMPPIANILLVCLWRVLARFRPQAASLIEANTRLSALRPIRALLLKFINPTDIDSHWDEQDLRSVVAYLTLCREARILDGGFAEFVSWYACKSHCLENWEAVQNVLQLQHGTLKLETPAHENTCLYPALGVRLDLDAEQDDQRGTQRVIAKITDPHEASNYFLDVVEGTKNRLYDSHESRHTSEICFVRQEGTELYFDCGISDPEFPHEGRWEDARQYYADFDRDLELFTNEDTIEPPIKEEEVTDACHVGLSNPAERLGLVSRLASGAIAIVGSIV